MVSKNRIDKTYRHLRVSDISRSVAAVFTLIFVLISIVSITPTYAGSEIISIQTGFPVQTKYSTFREVEISYRLDSPLNSENGRFVSNIRLTGGMLSDGVEEGLLFTAGPVFGVHLAGQRVTLMGGTAVTGLGKSRFQSINLGGKFHFTTHVGLGVLLSDHMGLMLGYQHMSNAGLRETNPGMNLLDLRLCHKL